MNKTNYYSVNNGLAVFGQDAMRIMQYLDSHFLRLASEVDAEQMIYPPMMRVQDLTKIDYFLNFPHLGLVVANLDQDKCDCLANNNTELYSIRHEDLNDGKYLLPSAACYNVYFHLSNQIVRSPRYLTTIARCYRNESEYNDLKRLWSFQMREIVCIGTSQDVHRFLSFYKNKIMEFAKNIGIRFEIKPASDPFYDKKSAKALIQKLETVKEEFIFQQSISAASVNFHKNFFGEKCNIRNENGESVFSGCVAFGIERWLYALLESYENDIESIMRKLENV